jgi:ribosome biogenesis SPOUT family RNA methylase Rps3
MKFIIEHMEPEMYEWCVIEYKHISEIVGKENLIFTNVKKGADLIKGFGKIYSESVKELKLAKICLLDPSADKVLSSSDKSKFDYFLFGGILGDFPRRRRTGKLKDITSDKRNLTDKQMSTDTAVLVAKRVLDGEKITDIPFKDGIEIEMGPNESVEFPFRYVLENGKPILPDGLIDYLKRREEF